jgi:hypothetical protein
MTTKKKSGPAPPEFPQMPFDDVLRKLLSASPQPKVAPKPKQAKKRKGKK